MLFDVQDLEGFSLHTADGDIGTVKNVYFDDDAWVVRYLVVDTGNWLNSRKVLVSPISIGQPNWEEKVLPASITKQQVEDSPSIDTDKPVSRQQEIAYLGYFGYPLYWGGLGFWGAGIYPSQMAPSYDPVDSPEHKHLDTHLRSFKAVQNYHIMASDGDIGHVQGLIVEEDTWAIRYLVVNTSNWWLGNQVLIAPQWIKKVSWIDGVVTVNVTRQHVKDSPTYDSIALLNREEELGLYDHYGETPYWAKGSLPEEIVK